MKRFLFFLIAFLLRLVLIYIAKLVDDQGEKFRFTDTDYDVFSEAATHVYNGNSPYMRHTYRYTPLAAYICLVNNIIHPLAAKVVFSIIDIIMGVFLWDLVESQNYSRKYTMAYVAFWVYNPTVMIISCRGSNDNIITALVYITIYFFLRKQYIIAGLWYGLAVHFKIYPVIYCIPFFFFIDQDR